MEELLKIGAKFNWTKDCIESFEVLKIKQVKAPILRFLDWSKKLYIYIDESTIIIGTILAQLGEEGMDRLNAYASWKLNKAERNYSTIEMEALVMIFTLKKYQHYLLVNPFIFYIDHQALKYPMNKPVH